MIAEYISKGFLLKKGKVLALEKHVTGGNDSVLS
jgi:hypothetical protein